MLQLGTGGQAQPVPDQRQFVLREGAEDLIRLAFRNEPDRGSEVAVALIDDQPVTAPPQDLLPPSESEMMLKIEIDGIGALSDRRGLQARSVEVELERQIGAPRKEAFPAPHDVSAGIFAR